jgi:cytidyltransferase-like protein
MVLVKCSLLKDYVFSIGCFDVFHEGHIKLFANMRLYGKELVIGVHDDPSIQLLKHQLPMDQLRTRLEVSDIE